MPRRPLLFRLSLGLLVLYWLAIFTGTHLPKIPDPIDLQHVSDKTLHYVGYFGLTLLLALTLSQLNRWSWRSALGILAAVAVYGILDELSQIPVGRSCSIYDWQADLLGAATALTAFSLLRRLWMHFRGPDRSSEHQEQRPADEVMRTMKPRSR